MWYIDVILCIFRCKDIGIYILYIRQNIVVFGFYSWFYFSFRKCRWKMYFCSLYNNIKYKMTWKWLHRLQDVR